MRCLVDKIIVLDIDNVFGFVVLTSVVNCGYQIVKIPLCNSIMVHYSFYFDNIFYYIVYHGTIAVCPNFAML
jgi:hypothetical protein